MIPPPVPPDGQMPQADGGPLDSGQPDALPRDATLPDAALDMAFPDAEPPRPDLGPDAAPACFVDPDPAPPPPEGLADLVVDRELPVGGPLAPAAYLATDLDGDAAGTAELVVARGGRAEALTTDGRVLWSSAVLGITDAVAVLDLDGDGRQEVVTQSARAVHILDALTGQLLWTSPEHPFGDQEAPLVQVLRVVLGDADGDDLPDLYLTDSGCTGGGTGYGAFFSFAQGVAAGAGFSTITGPRRGGRCARWHTLADLDADGRPELIRSDADGLAAFDPITGQRTLCGPIPGTAGAAMPHFAFDADPGVPGQELAVFDGTRLLVLAPAAGAVAGCPNDARALQVRWLQPLGDAVRIQGSAAVDLDGDGRLDLLTSAWRGDRWWILGYAGGDGHVLLEEPNALALGVVRLDGEAAVLSLEGAPRDVGRYGRLQLRLLQADPVRTVPLWAAPPTEVAAALEVVQHADSTAEFTQLVTLGEGADTRLMLRQADPGDTRTARMLTIDLAGQTHALPVSGDPGAAHRICDRLGCRTDRVLLSLEDGGLALLDPDLAVLNAVGGQPAVQVPTGDVLALTAWDGAHTVLLTLTSSGTLSGAAIPAVGPPVRTWRVQLGPVGTPAELLLPGLVRPAPRAAGPDLLVVRDATRNATGWRAVTATGDTLWLHTVDALAWRSLGGGLTLTDPDGHADRVLRYDQLNDLAALGPPCAQENEDPGLRDPLPACPNAAPTARVVTALDAETGACRWRTALRPNRCSNPSNQNISLADGDGDGQPEIYVTSTNVVARLDPADGHVIDRVDLGIFGAAGRGGGTFISAADPPLLRAGGNGPIDAFAADLSLRWRAALPDGLQGVAWLFRPALVVGEEVWISPGRGWPLYRYALAAQGEDVPPVGTVPLAGGAVAEPDAFLADVRALQAVPDALPTGDGVLITTDDGWLYALNPVGELAWTRRFPAVAGAAVVADLDDDGARELAVPLNDGRVQIADAPGPPPPRVVWDLPCPPVATCSDEADIDETRSTTQLCGEWYPVAGVLGYEVRVVDENGAILQDFLDVGNAKTAAIDGLALIPGARYALEVRSRWRNDGDLRRGAPGRSDGVLVLNDAPPTLELVADPARIDRPQGVTTLTLRATDDDLLAGWSLLVTTDAGELVQRLGGGPLAQADFEARRDWAGDDRAKALLPPGLYRVDAAVVDRGRNETRARVIVEICDGLCP